VSPLGRRAVDFSFISHGVTFLSDEVHHAIKAPGTIKGQKEKKSDQFIRPGSSPSLPFVDLHWRARSLARERDGRAKTGVDNPAIGAESNAAEPGLERRAFLLSTLACLEQHGWLNTHTHNDHFICHLQTMVGLETHPYLARSFSTSRPCIYCTVGKVRAAAQNCLIVLWCGS
jgi:hypothetical protein